MSSLAWMLVASISLVAPSGGADTLLEDASGEVAGGLAPLHHTRTDWNPDAISFVFRTRDGASVAVRLTHPDAGIGEPVAGRYRAQIAVEPATARATLAPTIDALMKRLTTRARLGPELRAPRPSADGANPQGTPGAHAAHRTAPGSAAGARVELWLCWLLLALGLATLPSLVVATREALGGTSGRVGGSLGAWLFVALVQLLFVPRLLVTVFSGYASVADASALVPVAKYGAFTTALYGPALVTWGPSTDVVIIVNLIVGLAAVLLAGAWAARLSGTARSGWIAILVVGLTPVLLRDRASESILVPIQFALLAAGVHLDRWLSESGRTHALGALAWGALALHGRPEAWIVVPILGLGWCLMDARLSRLRRGRAAWAGLLFALVVAPRAWSLYEYVGAASRHGDVPGLEGGGDLAGIFERLQTLNLLVSPHLHAVSLTVAALAALVVIRRSRLGAVSLVGGAVGIWIVLSTLDLPAVSVPRVQAPAVLFAGIMASVTVGALAQGPETWRRLAAMVALGLMLVPSPQVIDTLWAKTNAQSFDAWWDRAMESLPSAEAERCVVALSMSDPPQDVVLRHLPLYELPNLGVDGASLSISTFLETPASVLSTSCEALYVEGPQCYARSFDPQGPQPERAERLPICQRMHREWALAPIHVEDVPNEGNADFPFYGASPTLRYGLYRIVHLDPTNTGPRKVRPRSAP